MPENWQQQTVVRLVLKSPKLPLESMRIYAFSRIMMIPGASPPSPPWSRPAGSGPRSTHRPMHQLLPLLSIGKSSSSPSLRARLTSCQALRLTIYGPTPSPLTSISSRAIYLSVSFSQMTTSSVLVLVTTLRKSYSESSLLWISGTAKRRSLMIWRITARLGLAITPNISKTAVRATTPKSSSSRRNTPGRWRRHLLRYSWRNVH